METNCASLIDTIEKVTGKAVQKRGTEWEKCINSQCGLRAYCKPFDAGEVEGEAMSGIILGASLLQTIFHVIKRIKAQHQIWVVNPLGAPQPPCGLNARNHQNFPNS